jgi:ABC-2 type transport system ATP-binding protein
VVSMRFDRTGDAFELEVRDPNDFYDALADVVLEHGVAVRSFSSPDNNLESVFRYLVEA